METRRLGLIALIGFALVMIMTQKKAGLPAEPAAPAIIPPVPSTKAELERATGEKVLDVYDWNRLNRMNPLLESKKFETIYTGISPAVDFSAAMASASAQAAKTGTPTYIIEGGYYVDSQGQYIKGVGW